MGRAETRKKRIEHYRAAEAERTRRMRRKRREAVTAIKAERGCKLCGESHPACLQFHHRDPSTKVAQVNRMVLVTRSLSKVMEEIEKRDVLCANCHAKLHWNERHQLQAA